MSDRRFNLAVAGVANGRQVLEPVARSRVDVVGAQTPAVGAFWRIATAADLVSGDHLEPDGFPVRRLPDGLGPASSKERCTGSAEVGALAFLGAELPPFLDRGREGVEPLATDCALEPGVLPGGLCLASSGAEQGGAAGELSAAVAADLDGFALFPPRGMAGSRAEKDAGRLPGPVLRPVESSRAVAAPVLDDGFRRPLSLLAFARAELPRTLPYLREFRATKSA